MSMSSSSSAFSLDHHHHLLPSEQLYYVHCNICDTVLAVSVPCTSLFNTVTVRCGHCSNLLPLNMRGLPLPSTNHHQLHFGHSNFFFPNNHQLGGTSNPTTNFFMNQPTSSNTSYESSGVKDFLNDSFLLPRAGHSYELPMPPIVNRPPEKKQRVPSAYNRFIKEEIQRIKAVNPDISHREAFSAAAKNWAHFPNIQFGLMPDQTIKKTNNMCNNQDGEGGVLKDGYFASANVGVSPY